jgi:hypothetical protein
LRKLPVYVVGVDDLPVTVELVVPNIRPAPSISMRSRLYSVTDTGGRLAVAASLVGVFGWVRRVAIQGADRV